MPKPGQQTASKPPAPKGNKPADYSTIFKALGVRFDAGSEEAHAEECPFCGGEKFHVNRTTGQYKCLRASCGESGNAYTFINRMHDMLLEATTDQDLHPVRDKRDLPMQTLRRHGIVWSAAGGCFLIPFISGEKQKKVQNLLRYWLHTGDKKTLPILPVARGREGGQFRGERGPVQRLRDESRDGTRRCVGTSWEDGSDGRSSFVTWQRSIAAW